MTIDIYHNIKKAMPPLRVIFKGVHLNSLTDIFFIVFSDFPSICYPAHMESDACWLVIERTGIMRCSPSKQHAFLRLVSFGEKFLYLFEYR